MILSGPPAYELGVSRAEREPERGKGDENDDPVHCGSLWRVGQKPYAAADSAAKKHSLTDMGPQRALWRRERSAPPAERVTGLSAGANPTAKEGSELFHTTYTLAARNATRYS